MSSLPREINHVLVPPIKCQGIKTKLVPFIAANIRWTGRGRWIEPFLGSGVVAFNIQPERALLNDSNPHIIALYQQIYVGKLTSRQVSEHLSREGAELLAKGDEHYYFVRERFNRTTDPLDFLFLNRSCFNGVMRFNRKGQFNTPFCRKPERFRRALITKIANQVTDLARVMHNKQWEFRVGAWQSCLQEICREILFILTRPILEDTLTISILGTNRTRLIWRASRKHCPLVSRSRCGRKINIVVMNTLTYFGAVTFNARSIIFITSGRLRV